MRDVVSDASIMREARVYPSGELTVAKRVRNSASRPPPTQRGRRMVTGVSPRGARQMRRAVVHRTQSAPAAFKMLTLTSQDASITDEDMRQRFASLLAWLRKYWRGWDGWYIWAAELQERGVLHFHVLLDRRIPAPLFRRLRVLWAEKYGMGSTSVDIRHMRSGKGAAKYLSKYLGKRSSGLVVRLDGDGTLAFHPWPVSRHTGRAYVRSRFRGNPYGMSASARAGTRPVLSFSASVGAFPGLDGWHGVTWFADSPEHAIAVLHAVLSQSPPDPPRRRSRSSSVDANAYRTVPAWRR